MAAKFSSNMSSQIKQGKLYHQVINKRQFDHNYYHNVQNILNVHNVLLQERFLSLVCFVLFSIVLFCFIFSFEFTLLLLSRYVQDRKLIEGV